MLENFDFTPLAELIIAIISAVVTLYIIPFLKEKLTVEKYEKLKTLVGIGVSAAEQIYGGKTGQQKKEYVISFLRSKGINFDVAEVEAMIESEVYRLSAAARDK